MFWAKDSDTSSPLQARWIHIQFLRTKRGGGNRGVMYLTCRSNPTSGSSRTCYAPRAAPAFYMHHIYRAPRRLLTCIAFLRFRARMSVLMRTRPVDVGQRFCDFGCMYRVGPRPVMVTVLCIGACLVHTCGFYPHSLSLSELAPYHLLYI